MRCFDWGLRWSCLRFHCLPGVYENRNSSIAGDAQKLHREVLKASHDAKVERDRRDKELQKQKAQERKEKEKKRTQKQERRR